MFSSTMGNLWEKQDRSAIIRVDEFSFRIGLEETRNRRIVHE